MGAGKDITPWGIRVGLARRGWQTELRLTRTGLGRSDEDRVAAGFWARTMHWAGGIAEVCLHEHAIFDPASPEARAQLEGLVRRLDRLCLKAERDFQDTVPCQLMERGDDGLLVLAVNTFQTGHLIPQNRNLHPSEAIPPGVETGPDAHLLALLIAARDGLEAEDSLNPHFGRSRYARDCENRDWGYKLRLAVREANGVKVSYRPQEFTTRLLAPRAISGLIGGSKTVLSDLFRAYGAEGDLAGVTSNGFPPGFETLAEMIVARKAEEAARLAEREEDPDPTS
jgi:hypothetical protein